MRTIKPTGFEVALTTASSISNATLVKVTVTSGNPVITWNDGSDYANTTLEPGTFFLQKAASDTLASSASVLATPVAFT